MSAAELDSKKYEFLLESVEELSCENKNVENALSVYHLKTKHPSLFRLATDYTTKCCEINLEDSTVMQNFKSKLVDHCIQLYNVMQANEDVTIGSISIEKLTEKLAKEVKRIEDELDETRKIDEQLETSARKFADLLNEYQSLLKKHIEEYGLSFKISLDELRSDANCAKAQAYVLHSRLKDTKAIAEQYGDHEKLKTAKADREKLKNERRLLLAKINEQKLLLQQYESLDPQLLMEFQRLKEDLKCREWAVNQLNSSNCSEEIFL